MSWAGAIQQNTINEPRLDIPAKANQTTAQL